MKMIVSRDNSSLKDLSRLQEKKYRRHLGRYVVEGHKLVREALASGRALQVFVGASFAGEYAGEALRHPEVDWCCVTDALLARALDTVNPQGAAAVLAMPQGQLDVILASRMSPVIYLDGIGDPGNLGAIIRSGMALGVRALIMGSGCADPFSPKVVRASAGAAIAATMAWDAGEQEMRLLKNAGYYVAGADTRGYTAYFEASYSDPLALVIGSEAHGISSTIKDLCDTLITIPMIEGSESLNAAIAAAIIVADYNRRYIHRA